MIWVANPVVLPPHNPRVLSRLVLRSTVGRWRRAVDERLEGTGYVRRPLVVPVAVVWDLLKVGEGVGTANFLTLLELLI
jgi:hypothetical protein